MSIDEFDTPVFLKQKEIYVKTYERLKDYNADLGYEKLNDVPMDRIRHLIVIMLKDERAYLNDIGHALELKLDDIIPLEELQILEAYNHISYHADPNIEKFYERFLKNTQHKINRMFRHILKNKE